MFDDGDAFVNGTAEAMNAVSRLPATAQSSKVFQKSAPNFIEKCNSENREEIENETQRLGD